MSVHPVDVIARTLLYEGYLLYPYRRSAVKNQQRFNFGVLYPEPYAGKEREAWSLQTQCLVHGSDEAQLEVSVRFLQLIERQAEASGDRWHEAIEREVVIEPATMADLQRAAASCDFAHPATGPEAAEDHTPRGGPGPATDGAVRGTITVSVEQLRPEDYRITVRVENRSHADGSATRHEALTRSLVSTHVVLTTAGGGELISLIDPPDTFRDLAAGCSNVGVWPVLIGDEGRHDCMLASPIILYDYPQIAPESAGDLFDGTEIDEILALRILTLTDDEKREACGGDDRIRQILERTEALPPEQWAKLHGALRGRRRSTAGTS